MAKVKNFVSQELKDTVLSNDRIDKVHFNAKGEHYFEVYDHGKEKYGFIATNNVLKNGTKVEQKIPMLNSLITETVDREDILNAGKEDAPKAPKA